jgi:glucan phosphoethanolaminetransferase (alkaline phosphatase superfamily)
MEITDALQKLKQVQFIFWLNLAMSVFAFSVWIKSMDSPHLWKIICSGAGFAIFLTLTTLVLIRMLRLQKQRRD